MIEYVQENILNTDCDILVHSVNKQGVMGAGLARSLREKYPEILGEYYGCCRKYSFEQIRSMGVVAWYHTDRFSIASVFGQDKYGRDKNVVYTDYLSLGNGLIQVRNYAQESIKMGLHFEQTSIAIPFKIGCGLGNGSWEVVWQIIDKIFSPFPDLKVKIYRI